MREISGELIATIIVFAIFAGTFLSIITSMSNVFGNATSVAAKAISSIAPASAQDPFSFTAAASAWKNAAGDAVALMKNIYFIIALIALGLVIVALSTRTAV